MSFENASCAFYLHISTKILHGFAFSAGRLVHAHCNTAGFLADTEVAIVLVSRCALQCSNAFMLSTCPTAAVWFITSEELTPFLRAQEQAICSWSYLTCFRGHIATHRNLRR